MDPIDLNLRVGRLPAALAPTGGQLSAAEVDENFTNLRTAAEQLDEEKAPLAKWVSDTAPDPLLYTDWYTNSGKHYIRTEGLWVELPGTPGAAGASAYAVAVANGFVGSEAAWLLSLEGADGIQGIQGITGAGGPTSVSLSANQAFSTTSLADVTNMPTLTLAANTDYIIDLVGSFESAATTTGIGLALNVSGTVTRIAGQANHPVSATAQGACSQEANNAVTGATTGVRAIAVSVALEGKWFVRMGATGGTVQLRCRSEIASSAVTLHQGTRLRAFVA